ncbi:MAG: sugar dehydrogenase complex small subunit [Comamonas sp.]
MLAAASASRRQVVFQLAKCIAVLSLPALPASAASAASAEAIPDRTIRSLAAAFEQLTGIANANDALTRQYVTVLIKNLDKVQWDALVGLSGKSAAQLRDASLRPPLRDTVEFALQLWVSGMVGTTQVIAYTDAPIWSALSFTKPPGVCGGAFGYWADRPA